MVAKSDIKRQEFNEINMAREYAYQIGKLLKNKLGKLTQKTYNNYPVTPISASTHSITFKVTDLNTGTYETLTISYVATPIDSVSDVLIGLGADITNNHSEKLTATVESDYMLIVGTQGYKAEKTGSVLMLSDDKPILVESDVPACYVGYGKFPDSSLPRIIVTPVGQSTVCDRMEENTMVVDGEDREYTSSYLDFSLNLTCEAGSTEQVLRSGVSAQSILNLLRKMMVSENVRKNMQNAMDSVCYPIMGVSSVPSNKYTQWMDMATATADFSCIDMYVPEEGSGFIEAVELRGSVTEDDGGTQYKYTEDGEVVIYGETSTVDRRDV